MKLCPECRKPAEGRIVCAFCGTNLLQYRVKEEPKAPEKPKRNLMAVARALAPFEVEKNPDGVTYTIVGFKGGVTSVVIPEIVTAIANKAFYSCTSLTSVTIPESVKSIGDLAFSHCTSLTSVTIPEGAESIGDGAFYNCTSLTSVTIPESMKSIGDYAFHGCTALENIEAPERFLGCFVNLS